MKQRLIAFLPIKILYGEIMIRMNHVTPNDRSFGDLYTGNTVTDRIVDEIRKMEIIGSNNTSIRIANFFGPLRPGIIDQITSEQKLPCDIAAEDDTCAIDPEFLIGDDYFFPVRPEVIKVWNKWYENIMPEKELTYFDWDNPEKFNVIFYTLRTLEYLGLSFDRAIDELLGKMIDRTFQEPFSYTDFFQNYRSLFNYLFVVFGTTAFSVLNAVTENLVQAWITDDELKEIFLNDISCPSSETSKAVNKYIDLLSSQGETMLDTIIDKMKSFSHQELKLIHTYFLKTYILRYIMQLPIIYKNENNSYTIYLS